MIKASAKWKLETACVKYGQDMRLACIFMDFFSFGELVSRSDSVSFDSAFKGHMKKIQTRNMTERIKEKKNDKSDRLFQSKDVVHSVMETKNKTRT